MNWVVRYKRRRRGRHLFNRFLAGVGNGLLLAEIVGLNTRGSFLKSRYKRNLRRIERLTEGKPAWRGSA